jgi:hypothetical protein
MKAISNDNNSNNNNIIKASLINTTPQIQLKLISKVHEIDEIESKTSDPCENSKIRSAHLLTGIPIGP